MKTYLKDVSKIFGVIIVISLLVVVYKYLFDFGDYLLTVNRNIAYGMATFLLLSIGGLLMSAILFIGGYNDYTNKG